MTLPSTLKAELKSNCDILIGYTWALTYSRYSSSSRPNTLHQMLLTARAHGVHVQPSKPSRRASEGIIQCLNLQNISPKHIQISLLVLNTLSFLFHTTPLTNTARGSLLEQIKAILARMSASKHLSVAVTVQLATKMVGADGATANFDTAKKAVMTPQLGKIDID